MNKKIIILLAFFIPFGVQAFFFEVPEEKGSPVYIPRNPDTSNLHPIKKYHPGEEEVLQED